MTTARRDLTAMLRPRSIALVGATDRSRWSQNTFDNLINRKYPGAVHLVSRRGGIVHGRAAATSCAAVGAPIDLGLLMVPLSAIEEALSDLAAADVHHAVILTSGFAETGDDGAATQARLASLAREHDVSLLGPNCLGFVNFIDNVPLWTGGFRAPSKPGCIAVVTQSGANGSFIASLAAQHEIGLSHMVSTGNEADLDSADFIDHLVEQPEVRAIALFAETVRHAPSFAAAARRAIAAAKPIVVLKIGLSEITARSAQAHTGSLVGDDRVFDGVCRQLGIVRVDSIEDMLFTADVITRTGVLEPRGLGVVSISGGACEIVADRAQVLGVKLPALSERAVAELRAALPSFGTPNNPLDITGGAVLQPDLFEQGLRILGTEENLSAVACLFDVPVIAEQATEFTLASLRHIAAGLHAAAVPALMISHSVKPVSDVSTRIIEEIGLPYVSAGIHHGMNALAKAFWWSDQHRRLASAAPPPPDIAPATERPRSERATLAFLAQRGVPVVPTTIAGNADQAVAAARAIGGPVALKIASDDIAHKSDIGGVALNLHGDGAVGEAFRRIIAAAPPGARLDGVLVAPMRTGGVEIFVGCTRDAQWGPVLAVGLGGVWVEILRDVALRPLPIDAAEVRRMFSELRGEKLLHGARGTAPTDLDVLAAVVARIGDAAVALGPDLEALEVNPLWVRGSDVEALDAVAVWRRTP